MTRFVEFHLIQNFAPSNLNRDDTGAPKEALFGGHRRARISSQCLKKSARNWFNGSELLDADTLGTRTRHLDRVLLDELTALGLPRPDLFNEIVKLALKAKKGEKAEKGEDGEQAEGEDRKTLSYLMYLSAPEIGAFRELIHTHGELLGALAGKKKLKPSDIPAELKDAVRDCLRRSKAVDIALFGRMLADLPEANQDAACQVAHAISTHRVGREFDYFTAVDDHTAPGDSDVGMIGQVEFNAATFYRYAAVDVDKLLGNLGHDATLARAGLRAYTEALARAIPSGKQNSFAAHTPPAFIGVVLRHGMPINLANAFEKPVWPDHDKAISALSVEALGNFDNKLSPIFGDARDAWRFIDLSGAWPKAKGSPCDSLAALADWAASAVTPDAER